MESSSWQSELCTVRERNLYAFKKSLFCDVEFSVVDASDNKAVMIAAHKYVLAISSPVFEAMFYGELAETRRTIDLPDCTKEGLQELLHYVYSDEANLTGSNVMQVLYLSKKYMLPSLELKCREYLEKELKPEEVFSVLPQAKQLGDEKLEKHCWEIVDGESERAVSSEPFCDLSLSVLCQSISRDTLRIKEVDLFQAVDKWVSKRIEEKGEENNRDNKRAILGEEAIRLIRFPLMSQQEFAGTVLPTKILNTDEMTELIQIFSSLTPSTKMFNTKKRLASVIIPRNRFNTLESGWGYGSTSNAIDFYVNKPVSLIGVRLFGSRGNSYYVDLGIYQCHPGSNTIVSQISSSFLTEEKMIDDQYYGFTVSLNQPVKLDPGVLYTIAAKIRGPTSYYGKFGQASIECEDLVVKYKSSSKSSSETDIRRGQFPTIILKNLQ